MTGPFERRKFFADAMLGKLARWMRVLGYDVEYEKIIDDNELIKRSLEEGRTVLTRDTVLSKRRRLKGRAFFVSSDFAGEQLREVTARYPIEAGEALTRCLRDNAFLEDVEKGSIKEKVPPYVFETQERFSICPRCSRVYWAGTHKEKMIKDVQRLLKG